MELGNDLRCGWRQLRHSPGFAIAAVLTLALGIGATTTMFSVVDQVLLRPLPFDHPAQLVAISEASYDKGAATSGGGISLPDAQDWQTRSHTLQSVAYYTFQMPIVGGIANPHSEAQLLTSVNFLSMLGVQPAMGRGFAANENDGGASHVVVLGAEAWHTLFSSEPKIVGRVVSLNGTPHTIIGVMPETFRFQGGSDLLFSPLDISHKDLQDRSSGSPLAAIVNEAFAASLGFSRIASSMLSGVDVHNILLVIEAVTVILAITCITASYLPARRAAQTDPMQALRHE